jgi:hypothetical protein
MAKVAEVVYVLPQTGLINFYGIGPMLDGKNDLSSIIQFTTIYTTSLGDDLT